MADRCKEQSGMSNDLYCYIGSIHYTNVHTFQNQYTKGKQHIVTITHINVTGFSVGFFEISPVKRKFGTRYLYNERLMKYSGHLIRKISCDGAFIQHFFLQNIRKS